MGRFFSGLSLGLAMAAMSVCMTEDKIVWAATFIVTLILFYVFMIIEDKILASDGVFLNKILYFVSKNQLPYVMKYVEVDYEYISRQEMKYSKRMVLKAVGKGLTKYIDKYCWSSYGKDVKVDALVEPHTVNFLRRRNVWDMVEIDFHDRITRGKTVQTGMRISNLIDELGIAKPFLSLMTNCKIKERTMKVIIPKELKSARAKFVVYPADDHEQIIKSEELEYDHEIGGYSKNVSYPRKGWVYSIVWEWDE